MKKIENRTNAFDRPGRLPGIKHPSMVDPGTKHNASVSGSQDESEGESRMPLPLPPIKPAPSIPNNKLGPGYDGGRSHVKKGHCRDKYNTLKNEYSQQSLGSKVLKSQKKFHEDLKIDKARIFKRAFLDGPKNGKKKKYLNA